ncbi:MAG: hypothetical protein OEV42_17795 [Deltaproteobacteria bacterium]|nr:hypothetical protein [Deltaproteobacteria bacterium]
MLAKSRENFNLERAVGHQFIVKSITFTGFSKNSGFMGRLAGCFFQAPWNQELAPEAVIPASLPHSAVNLP